MLGFYDPFADFPKGATRLSYLVTGWFSNPEDDPLVNDFGNKQSIPAGNLTEEQKEQQFADLQAWAKKREWEVVGLTSCRRVCCATG